MSSGNTTAPADPTHRSAPPPSDDLIYALVVCDSQDEADRCGEAAFFDPSTGKRAWIIGRAVHGHGGCEHFFLQRPGEMIDCGPLRGTHLSREQLRVTLCVGGLRVHNIGSQKVFVDGTELPRNHSTVVDAGAVIEVDHHATFVVERRPRNVAAPSPLLLPLPRFGEPCAMGFAAESPTAWEHREQIALCANSHEDVLVLGETGTGKDLTALGIHAMSVRAQGPFIAVNCAVLTPELAAARLFGNLKGYPNPGTPETQGYFGDAVGGDMFLDEIGCLERPVQAILLRAMENGYERIGETKTRPKRCKVTAATNKAPETLAEDVLMRFGTTLICSALRARPSDIAHVARLALMAAAGEHADFAAKFLRHDSRGLPYVECEQSLVANLTRHPLPGNARQVRTLVNTAVREARRSGRLKWPSAVPAPRARELETRKEPEHVPAAEVEASVASVLGGLDAAVRAEAAREQGAGESSFASADKPTPSKSRTIEALDRNRWRFGPAARDLGISEPQLYRLRIKYGLHSPQGAQDPHSAE